MQPGLDGVRVWWHVVRVDDPAIELGDGVDDPVVMASVMKVLIALSAAEQIATGRLDGSARCTLPATGRTPGPVGFSLYADEVELSVRDLLVPTLTLSDNVASDCLLDIVGGVDVVNLLAADLGLTHTRLTRPLAVMLDEMADEVGFADYEALASHDPTVDGPPTQRDVSLALASSSALDPARGSRTTPRDMTTLLSRIWRGDAAAPEACSRIRALMAAQLTRHRIAAGFGPAWQVRAKSGGLMGVVRNEVATVETSGGHAYAVAIFTRRAPDSLTAGAEVDAVFGRLAAAAVAELERR